jgi:hypothetical protein
VVKDRRLAYTRGYGWPNRERKLPEFPVGSPWPIIRHQLDQPLDFDAVLRQTDESVTDWPTQDLFRRYS